MQIKTQSMKLLKKLPDNRSYEQVYNHYLVEKEIAVKLKHAVVLERKQIYATMYDELFSKVPDHPRLTRRNSKITTKKINRKKLHLLQDFLDKSKTFGEFAVGDCKFLYEISKYFKNVIGIDISDQRNKGDRVPDNFKLIIYYGYNLQTIKDNSIDIMYSDQLIEHFHPDETRSHFKIVYRLLKKDGKYVFNTPHSYSGPYDVSQYFSYEPECFHLKEWNYRELKELFKELNYAKFQVYWFAKGLKFRMPILYFESVERILGLFPKRRIRNIAKYLIPTIFIVAYK